LIGALASPYAGEGADARVNAAGGRSTQVLRARKTYEGVGMKDARLATRKGARKGGRFLKP